MILNTCVACTGNNIFNNVIIRYYILISSKVDYYININRNSERSYRFINKCIVILNLTSVFNQNVNIRILKTQPFSGFRNQNT